MPKYRAEITTTVTTTRYLTIKAKNLDEAYEKADDDCLTYYQDETQIEEVNSVELD